jgi:hypothetical protein
MKRNSYHTSNSSSGSDGPHSDIITIGFGRRPSGAQGGSLRNYPYNNGSSVNSSVESFRVNHNGQRATGSLVPGSSSSSTSLASSTPLPAPSITYNPTAPVPAPAVAMTPDNWTSTSPSSFPNTTMDNGNAVHTVNKRLSTGNPNIGANIQTPMGEASLHAKKVDCIDRTVMPPRPSSSRESTSSSLQTLTAPAKVHDRAGLGGGGPKEAGSWDPTTVTVRIHTVSPGPPPSQALPPVPYGRRLSSISTLSNQTRDSIPTNNATATVLEKSHPFNRSTPPPAYTARTLPIPPEKVTFSVPPPTDFGGLSPKKDTFLHSSQTTQYVNTGLARSIHTHATFLLTTGTLL